MPKEYRKKATNKAEQFDGSFEMMRDPSDYELFILEKTPTGFSLKTLEGDMKSDVGDDIDTESDGEH